MSMVGLGDTGGAAGDAAAGADGGARSDTCISTESIRSDSDSINARRIA
jgi:hypothetical protein